MVVRRICQSKICRRKTETPSFSREKSENLRFSADEQCSPLQHFDRNLPFSFKSKMCNLHLHEIIFYPYPGRTVMFCPDFAFLGRTDRPGGMKQPPGKPALCPKPAHRIWWTDANFLLATETKMCYNILVKISTASAPPEKPGSTTSRAVIMIPASVGSSMQIPLPLRGKISWGAICLHTA